MPQLLLSYIGRKKFEARLIANEVWGGVNGGNGKAATPYKEVQPDQFLKLTGHGMI